MDKFLNVTSPYQGNMGGILDELRYFIKSLVKEGIEETLGNQLSEQTYMNQTLTREELCKRWGCCKNTIRNKELEGLLTPIPVNGKKRVYSMAEVISVENRGGVRGFC